MTNFSFFENFSLEVFIHPQLLLVYRHKALTIWIKMLGEKHPYVAATYNNIGCALKTQGKYDEALIYHPKSFNNSAKSARRVAS